MAKVLWVADFSVKHNSGGAQRTNQFMIDAGRQLGHTIVEYNYDSSEDFLDFEYDAVITNNIETMYRRDPLMNLVLSHPNHIRYEHDSNSYLPHHIRKEVFGSAKVSIFLSDFHIETFKELYGDIFGETARVSPPIDSSIFHDKGRSRELKTLYVGFMHPLKGTQNFFDEVVSNPNKDYVVAGWGPPHVERIVKRLRNVEFLGKVSHEEMPDLFNKYTTLYYRPEKFEPFCRSVGEAALCGMELDCSDNIGAVHDIKTNGLQWLKNSCDEAPSLFWDICKERASL